MPLCTMGPLSHAWLFFPSSLLLHEAVVSSSAGDQLLILLSPWGAGPSPIPPTRVDPISLRLQAPSHFFVGYNYKPQLICARSGNSCISSLPWYHDVLSHLLTTLTRCCTLPYTQHIPSTGSYNCKSYYYKKCTIPQYVYRSTVIIYSFI